RPALESAQALEHILRPADRFAELAVAHHVDAGVGLVAHDLADGLRQALLIGRSVERLAALLEPQEVKQRLRPDEAADVAGEDAVRATLHNGFMPRCGCAVDVRDELTGERADIRREQTWAAISILSSSKSPRRAVLPTSSWARPFVRRAAPSPMRISPRSR